MSAAEPAEPAGRAEPAAGGADWRDWCARLNVDERRARIIAAIVARDEASDNPSVLIAAADVVLERVGNVLKGLSAGTCRSCGRPIWWLRTAGGRLLPLTDEGLPHFADCPQAERWRQRPGGGA